MADQNPLSYVAPGVSAGAATVLPSKPFDPQAFFADLIGQKKAEQQLELKKREDIEQHNLAWSNRLDKMKTDWWNEQNDYFATKAQALFDEMTDIALDETSNMRKVGVVNRANINRKILEFNHEVSESRRTEQQVNAIMTAAKSTPNVAYAEEGLAKMWEDVRAGTFSMEKRNEYLLPEKNWAFVSDDDIAKDIAKLIGTHNETLRNRNVKNPTEESIKLARERSAQTNSDLNRYLNYLVKKGPENGGITEDQKQERAKSIMNSAIASIDTANTEKTSIVNNFGSNADPLAKKSDWVKVPSDVVYTSDPKSKSSYVVQTVWSLPIAGSLKENVEVEQGQMIVQEISIIPQAIVDIPLGKTIIKAGKPISKKSLELMKQEGLDKYLGMFTYYPYIVGKLDGNKTIVPLTDKNNGLLVQGSLKKRENIAWDNPNFDKVKMAIEKMNLLTEKAKYIQ